MDEKIEIRFIKSYDCLS